MRTEEALALIRERVDCRAGTENVPLAVAPGRVLAEDVTAPNDVPPHDNSAVDGYAVFHDDLAATSDTRLPLGGRAAAGHPLEGPARRGTAVRIFTGAPMPAGPDSVVMQEDCRLEGDAVIIPPGVKRSANRRRRGEDVTAGSVVLQAGRRLRPQDLGQAASVGRAALTVRRPLRAALFSTGDEIAEPGAPLAAGQIYDANRYTITALLTGLGLEVDDLGILADELEPIRASLEAAAGDHDLIVTSGGVSVGDEDHVKPAVESQGSLHLWRLAIKPGRPIALGQVHGVPFVGLPGNPVAVLVTFVTLVRPMILRLMGANDAEPRRYQVPAGFAYAKKAGRREWLRGRLQKVADGTWQAVKYPRDGSGILSSLVESDGLIELAEEVREVEPGTPVDFLPFTEVFA
jgi:molybdopterin molybdotransferase